MKAYVAGGKTKCLAAQAINPSFLQNWLSSCPAVQSSAVQCSSAETTNHPPQGKHRLDHMRTSAGDLNFEIESHFAPHTYSSWYLSKHLYPFEVPFKPHELALQPSPNV